MTRDELYKVLRAISLEIAGDDESVKPLPEIPNWAASLEDLQIDMLTGQDYFRVLENRIPTKNFRVPPNLIEKLQLFGSLGDLCDYLVEKCFEQRKNYEVVYVDDEPDNLFVFQRRFGKQLNLKVFDSPVKALDYIVNTPQVALVITDEVMPKLSGNALADEVHKSKPNMKFILITGNPDQDEQLMYNSLRHNRFYEFIQKPVDFEKNGEEYLKMIHGLAAFDW